MLSAYFVNSITDAVQFPPVPAITGIRLFTVSTANLIVCFLYSKLIVEDSPVVPHTIILSALFAIWNSINFKQLEKFKVNAAHLFLSQHLCSFEVVNCISVKF